MRSIWLLYHFFSCEHTTLQEALSLRPSIGPCAQVEKWENEHFRSFLCVSVLEGRLGGALGVDGGWLPLPTRPQRYCDPASLVALKD